MTDERREKEGGREGVELKTGRENPVPTGTESRINRSYTVLIKKTENRKKPGKIWQEQERKRLGAIPDRICGYRI